MNSLKKSNEHISKLTQVSHTGLSSLQKEDSNSFVNELNTMKFKKPFSGSSIDGSNGSHKEETKKKLLSKLDRSEVNERLEKEKKEFMERIKTLEERYSEIEGIRKFSRYFVTTIRSMEELIEDIEIKYHSVKLIHLLHNSLKNFLESIEKVLKNFKGEINKNNEEITSLKVTHEGEKKKWEDILKGEQAKFQSKTLVQNLNSLKEKYNQMRINTEREKKEMTSHIVLLNMNNKMLMDKLKKLEEDTSVVNVTQKIEKLSADLQQTKKLLKDETQDKSNMGFKLYAMLEAVKSELKEKDNSFVTIINEHNNLLSNYKEKAGELKEYKKQVRKNEENMLMKLEDDLQMKLKFVKLEEILKEKNEAVEKTNRSVQELKVQLELQKEGLVQKNEVSMEGTLFDFVWDSPYAEQNDLTKQKAIDRQDNNFLDNTNNKDKLPKHNIKFNQEVKLDVMDIKKYSYLKPKYRALIDNLLPNDGTARPKYNPPFPIWLHVVIRAIFDSKFTEVLLSYNKGKRITRFTDFVYCWLGNFTIDKTTREVKILEYTEKETIARKNRLDLLIGLEAVNNAKIWEVTTFKDFLEEEFGLDELVYYLHCRFILFKGQQLSIPTAGFCVTHFMGKDKIFDAIDRIMHAYSEDHRKELKDKLSVFAKNSYKDPNVFDCGMVLRVLLEFYRKEKKENFLKFEELYAITIKTSEKVSSSKVAKPMFPFNEFYKIISETYNKNAEDLDICNVYREAFIGGGGNITCDSILLTFSETHFWINHLRLKGQNSEPKYDSRGDIRESDHQSKECLKVYT